VPRRATIELRRSVWLAPFFEGLKIQNCWRDCQHLSKPAPPNILLGLHPDAVIEQAVTLAAQAVGIRIDTPIILAGVMTWPVPRDEIEKSEEERQKYLAWRADAVSWAKRRWGDRLKCVVEHVDEGRLHLHYWALPPLRPDRRVCISDVDSGRRAAKSVKDAGGSKREQRAASDQAMREFQDEYWREVGSKHGLARLGPQRLRLTRQEWKDQDAERKRIAEAWRTLHNKHAALQSAANASVAKRITRLTNAFSKKLENLQAAVALHFAHYNLVRVHKTLRVTPAMAENVTDRLWSLEELVEQTSK
jgi:hypothetical protein